MITKLGMFAEGYGRVVGGPSWDVDVLCGSVISASLILTLVAYLSKQIKARPVARNPTTTLSPASFGGSWRDVSVQEMRPLLAQVAGSAINVTVQLDADLNG